MTERKALSSEADAREYVARLADGAAMDQLNVFTQLLIEENCKQNLISKASEEALWLRHIADSAQLLELVPRGTWVAESTLPWLDLGTGPGLPGLVISILRPELPVALVESRARRVEFLEMCVEQLGLENCRVLGQRLERITPFESCVISARAFAPFEKLLRLSAPFSTKETCYLLPKGRSAAHELSQAKPAIRKMFHVKHSLTDEEAGIIVSA